MQLHWGCQNWMKWLRKMVDMIYMYSLSCEGCGCLSLAQTGLVSHAHQITHCVSQLQGKCIDTTQDNTKCKRKTRRHPRMVHKGELLEQYSCLLKCTSFVGNFCATSLPFNRGVYKADVGMELQGTLNSSYNLGIAAAWETRGCMEWAYVTPTWRSYTEQYIDHSCYNLFILYYYCKGST